MHKKELGSKGASKKDVEGLSEEILYKIDIPANRYDMLCLEGIARALNIFNGRSPRVDYRLANMAGDPSHILSTHEQSSAAILSLPYPCRHHACILLVVQTP